MALTRPIFLAMAIVAGSASTVLADNSRLFTDVSEAVFQCVKETSSARQGTIYAPEGANSGTATTSSTLWTVVMNFAFSAESKSLAYTLVQKSWIVPTNAVWAGIGDMIAECRG